MTVDLAAPPADISPDDARTLTDRIKTGVEAIWHLIEQAYVSRAWSALDYSSWDDYCTREFGTSRLRLPREERQEVVASMRESGLSVRAIAAATGLGRGTVDRELSGVPNGTPDVVVGMDGKAYAPTRPTPTPAVQYNAFDGSDWNEPDEDPYTPPAVDRPVPVTSSWTDDEIALRYQLEAGHTIVVSLRGPHARLIAWAETRDLYIRIDRRTDWGNPFELPGDGDRAAVIAAYADHYLPHKPSLLHRLPELKGRALGCWCAPEPCHGDVLKAGAET